MTSEKDKIQLFGSDDEEEEDTLENFKIKPQFQGPHGQQLLELSAKLPERFKLDERFAEVFELEYSEGAEDRIDDEIKTEREKNIKILESVLGHEVGSKNIDKNKSVKKLIRFDPEDENDSHLVKNSGIETEKAEKKSKKKKKKEENVEQTVPTSTERYIEVCPNLKEILDTAAPFSFSKQFSQEIEEIVDDSLNTNEKASEPEGKIKTFDNKKRDENKIPKPADIFSSKQISARSKCDSFFISEGDPRLKEGIDFFKRPKPLDEIRVEWQKRREFVLELFRRKKRSSHRSRSTKVQSMQNKFAVRKQNYKK